MTRVFSMWCVGSSPSQFWVRLGVEFSQRIVIVGLFCSSVFLSIACDTNRDADGLKVSSATQINCDVSKEVLELRGRIELKNDLQVVRPQSRTTSTFGLTNQSGVRWQIDKLGASCGCTVASVSKREIEPGEQLTVTTEFTAGGEEFKESYIDIGLATPAALSFRLTLMANVRLPMSLSDNNLDFGLVEIASDREANANVERVFEVRNFTQIPWSEIVAESSADWCCVKSVEALRTSASQSPCQIWRVACAICPDSLPTEKETASIHVRSAGSNSVDAAINVTAKRKPIMTVSPPSLFFGVVKRGEVVTRKLTLTVNMESQENPIGEVQCVASPGLSSSIEINVEEQGTKARVYLITAKLQQDDSVTSGQITGQLISLAVRDRPEMRVEVPVFAKFVD